MYVNVSSASGCSRDRDNDARADFINGARLTHLYITLLLSNNHALGCRAALPCPTLSTCGSLP